MAERVFNNSDRERMKRRAADKEQRRRQSLNELQGRSPYRRETEDKIEAERIDEINAKQPVTTKPVEPEPINKTWFEKNVIPGPTFNRNFGDSIRRDGEEIGDSIERNGLVTYKKVLEIVNSFKNYHRRTVIKSPASTSHYDEQYRYCIAHAIQGERYLNHGMTHVAATRVIAKRFKIRLREATTRDWVFRFYLGDPISQGISRTFNIIYIDDNGISSSDLLTKRGLASAYIFYRALRFSADNAAEIVNALYGSQKTASYMSKIDPETGGKKTYKSQTVKEKPVTTTEAAPEVKEFEDGFSQPTDNDNAHLVRKIAYEMIAIIADKSFDAAEIIYPDLLRRATEQATAEASSELEAQIASLKLDLISLTETNEQLRKERLGFKKERDATMAELKAAKQEVSELKTKLDSLSARKKQASEEEKNFMGNLMDLMKGHRDE
ncbi:hypothetical protein CMI37_06005 [Candidatus Pacearchaeota archaeon]|nr:hypothetical protein [Candidatus Pacearchaeota archaeon]